MWLVLVYRPTCAVSSSDCYAPAGDAYHHQANQIEGHWFKNGIEFAASGMLVESAGDPPLYPLFCCFCLGSTRSPGTAEHRHLPAVPSLCSWGSLLVGSLVTNLAGQRVILASSLRCSQRSIRSVGQRHHVAVRGPLPAVDCGGRLGWLCVDPGTDTATHGLLGRCDCCCALRPEAVSLFGFLVLLIAWGNSLGWRTRLCQAGVGLGIDRGSRSMAALQQSPF